MIILLSDTLKNKKGVVFCCAFILKEKSGYEVLFTRQYKNITPDIIVFLGIANAVAWNKKNETQHEISICSRMAYGWWIDGKIGNKMVAMEHFDAMERAEKYLKENKCRMHCIEFDNLGMDEKLYWMNEYAQADNVVPTLETLRG